jgi:alpha-tubulin suppressor-like RCC1 family protein
MNYYIFNHIIDYLLPKEIIKFLLHSNKNMINSIEWNHLNSKFNYTDIPSNILFSFSEGFNIFLNNFKFSIKQISGGCHHTLILKNDNTLWGSGANYEGQLGLVHIKYQVTFVQILEQDTPVKLLRRPIDNIKSVFCGYAHSLILKNDDTLWGSGHNDYGQLGLGHTNNQHTFVQLSIDNIKNVFCDSTHSLIMKNDDTLWGSGHNGYGQLGLGHTNDQHTFVQLLQQDTPATLLRRPIDNVKSVSGGGFYTLILKNDNTLWGSGWNYYGELGLGHTDVQHTFVQIPIDNVKSIHCGYRHSLILKNDNTLWGSGYNDPGQLGLGHTNNQHTFIQILIDDIKSVFCGFYCTFIFKNDNTLWGSGSNDRGQLGLGYIRKQHTFVQLSVDNIKSISCGYNYTIILKNDNTLWSSGCNVYNGQLALGHTALGHTDEQHTFVQVHL